MSWRGLVTGVLALVPALVFLVLLALGWQDYDLCVLETPLGLQAALLMQLALVAAVGAFPVAAASLAERWAGRCRRRLFGNSGGEGRKQRCLVGAPESAGPAIEWPPLHVRQLPCPRRAPSR